MGRSELTQQENVQLPSILSAHQCEAGLDPFAVACAQAQSAALGAGDVVFSPALDVASAAIVLEPEVSNPLARQMLPLTTVALGDCLGALLPPKVAVEYLWPRTVFVNAGRAGYVSCRSQSARDDEIPSWLVVAIRVHVLPTAVDHEPGETPDLTALANEGGADLSSMLVVSTFAARFIRWLDVWQDAGFEPIEAHWRQRSIGRTDATTIHHAGTAFCGTVLGLTQDASLRMRLANDEFVTLDAGQQDLAAPLESHAK